MAQAVINDSINFSRIQLLIPAFLLVILAMMTLPMPPFLLDVFFTFNIALSLVVLLVTVYSLRPLDFAVFPTVLLIATLLRLALNVASTRVVLIEGHAGGDAAGEVIQAFGEVVIGGNYAVGLVVFVILIIINFVVVTKGAGRISEVSARFTLDAMPGKQMAIDADLNAGIIEADEAKSRREEISSEADFYGSMDGASKFVKGDAVAGILILLINLLGGLAIGMLQHSLEFADAMEKYSLLTIGDGLVAQIPSLLLSTSAAILVTRTSTSQDMGSQVAEQLFESPKPLMIAAGILAVMGAVPGMPHVAFLGLAGIAGAAAYFLAQRQVVLEEAPVEEKDDHQIAEDIRSQKTEAETPELCWDDVKPVDVIGLEVGYKLIPMVDKNQGGELLSRIKGIRKKLSQELGFLVPSVHIRDNLDLMPAAYRISLMGVTLGEAEIHPDKELAINPGQVFGKLSGLECKDPAFGLDAIWIEPESRENAQTKGYTVVDVSTVIATHLNQLMQDHSYELIGHDEVEKWLEQLSKSSPKLAEELVPNLLSVSVLLKVLQNLLREQVPVRDMRTIAEALTAAATNSQDPAALTAAVRVSICRLIIQNINGLSDEIPVITLDPELEQLLHQTIQQSRQSGISNDEDIVFEPGLAENLQKSLADSRQKQELAGAPAILLVSSILRPILVRFVRYATPGLHVLSYQEIPDNKQITIVATIGS